jgi:hypothetical protein
MFRAFMCRTYVPGALGTYYMHNARHPPSEGRSQDFPFPTLHSGVGKEKVIIRDDRMVSEIILKFGDAYAVICGWVTPGMLQGGGNAHTALAGV